VRLLAGRDGPPRASPRRPLCLLMAAIVVMMVSCDRDQRETTDRPDNALRALIQREWDWRLEADPLFATTVGRHEYDDRLTDQSPEAIASRTEATKGFASELREVDRSGLSPVDQINYDMFDAELDERLNSARFREFLLPLNADSGFHTNFPVVVQQMPYLTTADYEKYLVRLGRFPRYMDQNIALMREGLRSGITIPQASLDGIESSITPLITEEVTESIFWKPFAAVPGVIPAAERERIQAEGRKVISQSVTPAYRKFLDFMTKEYVPGARKTLAAAELPEGRDYYAFLVRKFTTLDLDAEAVHRIGLEQVAAIRAEMDEAVRQTGFKGTFQQFLEFLRTDPRFYPRTADALIERASYLAKRMDGELPSLFGRLPRQPYTVAPVPDYLAPKYTAGRYNGSPPGGSEPGYYWVNTYALDTRPLYNLEALTLHEAVPGHHLQTALAYELEDLPEFRKWTYLSAFGEGWGLYSEWLGLEAGFYTDPYSNFGRLTYAMWRAARLVVDTGIHAKGWTRQQATDYLAARTALSLHECTTEVDRYISWPGQALSYKIGELKIRELREKAEQALGERFDVRRFHDAVLGNGSVPLTVLEQVIDRFIEAERAG
jgi:uncharacterized protein (DUF885 family)